MGTLSSEEAVEALRAIGRKVELTGDDLGLWSVDDHECTDGELIALAHLYGLAEGDLTGWLWTGLIERISQD